MAFFCWGLFRLVGNTGLFDRPVYGARRVAQLIRGKWQPSRGEKDDYLAYVRARPRHPEVRRMMILTAVFAALSLAASFAAG